MYGGIVGGKKTVRERPLYSDEIWSSMFEVGCRADLYFSQYLDGMLPRRADLACCLTLHSML